MGDTSAGHGTVRIVHCSDLHFGSSNHEAAWASFRADVNNVVQPQLVLVTGDLVHTPELELYRNAAKELDGLASSDPLKPKPYLVCAGNHDRHPYGNALGGLTGWWHKRAGLTGASSWFDNSFTGRIPTVGSPCDRILAVGSNKWNLRILGIDTSSNARLSAQGHASNGDIEGLGASTNRSEADLVIVIHHHHLLPIAELERSRQGLSGLLQPTIMLNAGTVLEALARSHVDMVLHGHQHCRVSSRYGSLNDGQLVTILGAGSATGNGSSDGCELRRASYNVIELRPDRSVHVQERSYDGLQWVMNGPSHQVLDGRGVRRARFFRRAGAGAPPTSRVGKCVEFRSDRTIDVNQTWTDWALEEGRWRNIATNSSGVPSPARVTFEWLDSAPEEYANLQYVPHPSPDHTYRLDIDKLRGAPRLAKRINISYSWLGGGVLTSDDLSMMDPVRRGGIRAEGREFSGFRVTQELESLSILVRLPRAHAPDLTDVEVLFAEGADQEFSTSVDLRAGLRHHAPGLFSLEIPFPLPDFRYFLTWPVAAPRRPSEAAERFRRSAEDGNFGKSLLEAFSNGCGSRTALQSATLGLYVPQVDQEGRRSTSMLWRVAELVNGEVRRPEVPQRLSLRGAANALYRQAWWGSLQRCVPGAENHDPLFMTGERGLAVVPIRSPVAGEDVCWGLIRMGLHPTSGFDDDALLTELARPRVVEAFAEGVLSMLHSANGLPRVA